MAVVSACGAPPRTHLRSSATPDLSPIRAAAVLADRFMSQLVAGDYMAQWRELAPAAQAQWPSAQARTEELSAKFSGASRVVAFRLGNPHGGATWYSREDPSVSVAGAVSIPVSVTFREPGQVTPAGVAADYTHLQLIVAPGGGARAPQVVGAGPASIDAPVIEPASVPARTASVPILMYHLVGPYPDRSHYTSQYSYEIDYGLTVPPGQFSSEMSYLVQEGYSSISLVRLADYLLYGLPLPAKPVVITFDDGFANEYQYALPVLKADHLTATFLPCSGLIGIKNGQEYYMTANELSYLASHGFWVEDHTYNDGTVLWGQSNSEIQFLAGQTAAKLEGITGYPIQFISYSGLWPYPSPATTGPPQNQLFSQLAQLGYVGGLQDNWLGRFAWSETSGNLWELPRVRAYPQEPTSVFAGLLAYG